MYSKLKLLLLFVIFFSTSCNLKIGEAPPEVKIPEYKPDSCLIKSTDSFGAFFRGNAATEEIGTAWDCFSSMVKSFKANVRCKLKEQCSPGELARFVEDNFFDENKTSNVKQKAISLNLQKQLMKVKKLFLGGNLEYITPQEMDLLIGLMENLKGIFKDLNPSMKVLTLNWESQLKSGDLTLQDFESANINFIKIINRFSSLIYKNDNEYFFDDVYEFLSELAAVSDSTWSWLGKFEEFLPLVKKLKKSITGGNENSLLGNEWELFLRLGAKGYVQYLRYYYFIQNTNPEYTSLKLAYYARTIEESFLIFYELLSFKESHQISKDEIYDILNSFSKIWKDFKVSPELTTELMKIKMLFVGGNTEGIGQAEFLKAQSKVQAVRSVVEEFLPYYDFFGLNWRPELLSESEALDKFEKGRDKLKTVISKINTEVQLESGYSLKDFFNLFEEVNKLYPQAADMDDVAGDVKNYACLIQIGTDVLLNKNNYNLGFKCENLKFDKLEFSQLLTRFGEVFSYYMKYHYFIKKQTIFHSKYDQQIQNRNLFIDVINYVYNILNQRKSKMISYTEIDGLINELVKVQILPKELKVSSLKLILKSLLEKILVVNGATSKRKVLGFELAHIEVLKREYLNFMNTQLYFYELYENKLNYTYNYNFFNVNISNTLKATSDLSLKYGLSEFLRHFQTPYPLTMGKDKKLIFVKNSNPYFGQTAVLQMNLTRFLASIIIRSYSKQNQKVSYLKQITECELKELFHDIKPLLIDMDIISPTSGDGFIESRFLEANLFLPHADGNDFASFEEVSELADYIFSALILGDQISVELNKNCKVINEGNLKLMDLDCIRKVYYELADEPSDLVFNSMPSYKNYVAKEDVNKWNEAFLNNLKATGYVPRVDNKVPMGDLSLYPHILQYEETIFLKFDENYDGIINKVEGIKAFPAFASLLRKVAKPQIDNGDINEADLEALFTYILKYGAIPACDKPLTILCVFEQDIRNWLDWKNNYKKSNYDLSANRSKVAKILGLIADLVASTPKSAVQSDNKCQ
ncbi:MAG: hypothetical protein L6Q37_01065 [Bdellovibrionaceae bacterium]|nr:hypothetical protein [Pseudobdellovibrionaceae bacterium]NUM58299.1 hypothetical protein [Pseudobdellovibrionaceae bacterium]